MKHFLNYILVALAASSLFAFKISNKSKSVFEIINSEGNTIDTRFNVPPGYQRLIAEDGSFENYLRKPR
jgi:hypothetical protein